MRYLLMIYSDSSHYAKISPKQMGELMQGYEELGKDLDRAGVRHSSERLQPIHTATTVRIRDGKTLVTDGPFAETKEQIGGFYLVEAPDLDAAIAWAKKIPTVKYGSIEIRPIWEESMDQSKPPAREPR
jgi:hypothetical protein